jgi:hypothetical protein
MKCGWKAGAATARPQRPPPHPAARHETHISSQVNSFAFAYATLRLIVASLQASMQLPPSASLRLHTGNPPHLVSLTSEAHTCVAITRARNRNATTEDVTKTANPACCLKKASLLSLLPKSRCSVDGEGLQHNGIRHRIQRFHATLCLTTTHIQ